MGQDVTSVEQRGFLAPFARSGIYSGQQKMKPEWKAVFVHS